MPDSDFEEMRFTVDRYTDPREKVELWKSLMISGGRVIIPDERKFCGTFSSRKFGELRAMRIKSGTFIYERDLQMTRAVRRDHVMVNVVRSGRVEGLLSGRRIDAGPGSVMFSRMSRTMSLRIEEADWLALIVPRSIMETVLAWSPAFDGKLLHHETPQAVMLKAMIGAFAHLPSHLSPDEVGYLCRSTLAQLAVGLTHDGAPTPRPDDELASSVRRFISDRMTEPGLNAKMICKELSISRSALYRAMEGQSDVAGTIRRLRLRAVHSEIAFGQQPDVSLAEIARSKGLPDARNFRRAFQREFGYSPSELRRKASQGGSPKQIGVGIELERWFSGAMPDADK